MNQERLVALEAIKKKLKGHVITYEDSVAVMNQFAKRELGDIFVAYFAAAGMREGFTEDELYFLTKAMVESGRQFDFKGIVADKHSIGGLPGTRATMIIVPIIAAAGYLIPKTSSRAITTPAGTADCMEVLAPVEVSFERIQDIVTSIGGCIVWGGHLGIAPADDVIIRVEEPLAFESYDKIIISILAKKVAASSKLLVLDVPVGPSMKIKYVKDARMFGKKFGDIAERFGIKVKIDITFQLEPAGRGIGPMLESRDALKVLEQTADRPIELEYKALKLASRLLDMCFAEDGKKLDGLVVAEQILKSKKALFKFKEIVKAQGGNPDIASQDLGLAQHKVEIKADKSGKITMVNNFNLTTLAKILGAPLHKKAGIIVHARHDDKIAKNDILMELYAEDRYKLQEALDSISNLSVYEITT